MSTKTESVILVTGATGNVGQRVARELVDRGLPVRAFVRDAVRAAPLFDDGIELAIGDFADAASVRSALDGVDAVFLACNGPRQVEFETGLIEAASAAGVGRIVKLSSYGEVGCPVSLWDWNARIERHLFDSGLAAASVRPTFSMANLLGFAGTAREHGKLFAPADGARIAWIHPGDVADVSVALLTEGRKKEHVYDVTGPKAVTFNEIADTLSAVVGRRVEFVPISDEAARDGFLAAGLPDWAADGLVALFAEVRKGVQEATTDTVRRLLGREPRTIAEFVADHADAFRGNRDQAERETVTGVP